MPLHVYTNRGPSGNCWNWKDRIVPRESLWLVCFGKERSFCMSLNTEGWQHNGDLSTAQLAVPLCEDLGPISVELCQRYII